MQSGALGMDCLDTAAHHLGLPRRSQDDLLKIGRKAVVERLIQDEIVLASEVPVEGDVVLNFVETVRGDHGDRIFLPGDNTGLQRCV